MNPKEHIKKALQMVRDKATNRIIVLFNRNRDLFVGLTVAIVGGLVVIYLSNIFFKTIPSDKANTSESNVTKDISKVTQPAVEHGKTAETLEKEFETKATDQTENIIPNNLKRYTLWIYYHEDFERLANLFRDHPKKSARP